MENNNGRGIFYGVIGVATLVVAIIGATFAFFAASASGNENAVAANSVSLAGTITLTENPDARQQLIPTTEEFMKQSFVQSGSGAQAKCKGVSQADENAIYDLCSPYEFTIKNTANVAQTVYVTLTANVNTFTNLKYCVYEGATTDTVAKACGAVPTQGSTEDVLNVSLEATTGTKTYTIVTFIEETDADQTTSDSGKSFAATVTASTSGGENKVTGVIASAG